jgi:protocatechuate 4,5-dioxygenase beta chain
MNLTRLPTLPPISGTTPFDGDAARKGEAILTWPSDKKVAVLASGGLSHQLDGERAGFINKRFDLQFLQSLESNPQWATQFSIHELVEQSGTQGVELLMWLAMRAALTAAGSGVRKVHSNYHIPISNTATAVLALETRD